VVFVPVSGGGHGHTKGEEESVIGGGREGQKESQKLFSASSLFYTAYVSSP